MGFKRGVSVGKGLTPSSEKRDLTPPLVPQEVWGGGTSRTPACTEAQGRDKVTQEASPGWLSIPSAPAHRSGLDHPS